ncbi:ATP-binding protein [Noviherbaspirillum soli]|uniref:ATP-binding protein n=1 Tax=Noviherbaspirillum soli TaxID=1064518 RepID=UPI00188D650A|nr:ATP-binding protein [Noviherbaspirillum soli]
MNKAVKIQFGEAVQISRHYRRSVRVDADIGRMDVLEGYVLTDTAREALSVMARQINGSTDRAFTWTGPYGGGKSSLAVMLASALSTNKEVRTRAAAILTHRVPGLADAFPVTSNGWLVLPVVGKRGSVSAEVAAALDKALGSSKPHNANQVTNDLVTLAEDTHFDGVLVLVDEMGKFLEAAAAGGEDIHFFQDLAEKASRCQGRLIIVGLLHQSFRQYASRLGIEAREEWAKIQGRYGDISFVANGDEVVQLIGNAIECEIEHPHSLDTARIVATAIASRRPSVGDSMAALLDNCWPLHPITAALLGPASRRQFGQNERSVFGFLSSLEPYGFQDFLQSWNGRAAYGADKYWDYLRANLEQAILASPDGHRWAQAVEAVERAEAKGADGFELALAKILALVDIFRGTSGLLATNEVLCTALSDVHEGQVTAALEKLSQWRVAVYRKHIASWTVYEGSDFDIDQAVSKARASFSSVDTTSLTSIANLYPILAKRHYHETGTFRWMGVSLHTLQEVERLADSYKAEGGEFGRFALVLPDQRSVEQDTLAKLAALQRDANKAIVFGVPPNFQLVGDLGAELVSLRIVEETSPELDGDAVARREVGARLLAVKGALEEALREAVARACWIFEDGASEVESLSATASTIADDLFVAGPNVWSELINRDVLSTNSVKARRDLMHRMVNNGQEKHLGIDGFPAERGLYETVLSEPALHGAVGEGAWGFTCPAPGDNARLYALWDTTKQVLSKAGSKGIKAKEIYELWGCAPYGVKAGLMPVWLLAFALSHSENIAIYRDGMFEPTLTDVDVDELLQDPRRFELRWVDQDSEHVAAMRSIANSLRHCHFAPEGESSLDVARSLVKLAFSLSSWAKRTQRVSKQAKAIRDILLRASDPNRLLLIDLPATLGVEITDVGATIEPFLKELLDAYPQMLRKVDKAMAESLDALEPDDLELRERAEPISQFSADLRLQGFAARLMKRNGSLESIEGIFSLVANKPPRDWTDLDIDSAVLAVSDLALAFRKAEALINVQGLGLGREAISVVIGTGGSSTVVTKTFELARRDKRLVENAANDVLAHLESLGLSGDLLFAALAKASSTLHAKEINDA